MGEQDSEDQEFAQLAQRRLEWLEEALRIAHASGALARARAKKHREQDRQFFGEEKEMTRAGLRNELEEDRA